MHKTYLPIDFETETGGNGDNDLVFSVVDDGAPQNNVGKLVKGDTNPWDNVQFELTKYIDLTGTNKTISFKWKSSSTADALVKLENSKNGSENIETTFSPNGTGNWETISVEFTSANDQFGKLVIFADQGLVDTTVHYIDDITAEVGDDVMPTVTPVMPIDFQTNALITSFDGAVGSIVNNPQTTGNSSSKVMKIVRGGGKIWAGSKLTLDNNLDFSSEESVRFKLYTSAPIGTKIAFKLEGTGEKEIAAYTTVTEAWETLTYDFSGELANYNSLVFLCDLGNLGDGSAASTFYIDDVVQYDSSVAGPDLTLSDLTQDGSTIAGFDAATSTYNIELAEGTTTVPTLAATASDTNATVQVTAATSLPGTTTVLVTAADETFTNTITVNFSVAATEVYAPDPTADISNVLSVFGSTYGNLAGTDFDPDWGQSTDAVAGDEYVLNGLNYQGVLLGSAQDISGYRYLHIDYYSDDSTELGVSLISTGSGGETKYALDVTTTGEWNSVDIPLTAFTAVDLTVVDQMKFDGNGTIRLDNIYFIETAPNPTANTSDVLSVFGTTYGNLAGTDFDPNWGQSTDAVAGDEYVLNGLNYQGIAFGSAQDVSAYDYLHIDYYSDDSTELGVYLISTGSGGETKYALDVTTTGEWNSVDIPLTAFTAVDLTLLDQMKFDGNGTIRLDNIYFLDSAPEPTADTSDVLSVFGSTYGNLAGTDFDPDWGQSTDAVAGDEYVLNGLNYQGVLLGSAQDVSAYDYLHIDYKSDDSTELGVSLISTGSSGETKYALDVTTTGEWNSVDIPLTAFTAVDLTVVDQMKFDGNGTIRLDNMYFWKVSILSTDASLSDLTVDGSTIANFGASTSSYSVELPAGTVPTVAATPTDTNATVVVTDATSIPGATTIVVTAQDGTTNNTVTINFTWQELTVKAPIPPARNSSDVISIYSNAYTDINLAEFPTGWSDGTHDFITIDGDNTIKATSSEFIGIVSDYGNGTDLTQMEFMHIDYFSASSAGISVKLVNTITDTEDIVSLGTTIVGEWKSVDIDMTGFSGLDVSQITQFIIDPAQRIDVYYDNFYFYKGESLSVGNIEAEKVRIAPNPTTGLINVTGDIYNTSGQLVLKNSNDLSELPSGLYFIRVIANGSVSTSKVIKR